MPKQPIKKKAPPKKEAKKQLPRAQKDTRFQGRISPLNEEYIQKIQTAWHLSRTAAVNVLITKGYKAMGEL